MAAYCWDYDQVTFDRLCPQCLGMEIHFYCWVVCSTILLPLSTDGLLCVCRRAWTPSVKK